MSTAKKISSKITSKTHRRSATRKPAPAPGKRPARQMPGEKLEMADKEELAKLGDSLDPSDPNFKSELDYDGYRSIEESDNDSYNSRDLERNDKATRDLTIEDREEDSDAGEEDLVDPQENRK